MVIIGAVLCLFGKALINYAIFGITTGVCFTFGVFYTLKVMDGIEQGGNQPSTKTFWIVVAVWALASLFAGFCALKLKNIGIYVLGGLTGILMANMISQAIGI